MCVHVVLHLDVLTACSCFADGFLSVTDSQKESEISGTGSIVVQLNQLNNTKTQTTLPMMQQCPQ